MSKVTVKVEGVAKTLASLKKWQIIKRQACEDTLKAGGFKIERQAKCICPVKTGRLRSSISTNWSGSGQQRGKVDSKAKADDGIGQPGGPRGLVVVVGTNVKYGRRVEHGFIGQDKLGRDYHQEGQPYLTPAYLSYEGEIEKDLAKIMKKDEKV
jgi:hypothetical protein